MDQTEGLGNQDVSSSMPESISEKMLPQSEVNKIVGDRKREAYERGRKDALAEAHQMNNQEPQYMQPNMGGMNQMSQDQIRQMIAEESQKRANMEMTHRVANDFVNKMKAGAQKHPDFESTVAELNLPSIPHVVQLAAGTDNTSDVMYHLGKNPSKIATLTMLAHVNPNLANMEMQKLSESLKRNETGAQAYNVNEPLSHVTPSTSVGVDNGSNSIKDLRKKSWARA